MLYISYYMSVHSQNLVQWSKSITYVPVRKYFSNFICYVFLCVIQRFDFKHIITSMVWSCRDDLESLNLTYCPFPIKSFFSSEPSNKTFSNFNLFSNFDVIIMCMIRRMSSIISICALNLKVCHYLGKRGEQS